MDGDKNDRKTLRGACVINYVFMRSCFSSKIPKRDFLRFLVSLNYTSESGNSRIMRSRQNSPEVLL